LLAGSIVLKLEKMGVPVSAVLRRAGLPGDRFQQVRVLVRTEELFALWRAIGEVSKDPTIGLKLGTETKTERFHPSGIAALSTESFGTAIDHMARMGFSDTFKLPAACGASRTGSPPLARLLLHRRQSLL
jgi:hypothetical protein